MKSNLISLIDFEKVNGLLEGFNKTSGFVTAILDLEGNILSKSGWRKICTDFHRVHPETSKKCTISDTELAGKLDEGEKYHFYECLNGLVDVAVPIVINGEHIANLFSGQFFFEKPKKEFFIQQAKKYEFDTTNYLDALDKVPVVSEEEVKIAMEFLLNMTEIITDISIQKLEQKRLNDDLKKSEEQFRLLYNNSPDMYVSVSPDDATILFCNDTLLKETGYSREELIGFPIFNMYHSDCMDNVKAAFEQFTKTGEVKNRELILKRKDGSKIDVSLSVYAVRDENGKILYSMSAWRDITERKKTENELIASEEKFKALYDNAPLSYQSLNEDGSFKDVNPFWLSTLGYERDEVIGKYYKDFLHPDWKAHFEYNFPKFKKRGYVSDIQFKIMHKDGHYLDISFEGCIGYNPDGSFKQTYCVFKDITGSKRAEEAILESEAKFKSLMQQSPFVVELYDIDGLQILVNKAYEELWSFPAETTVNKFNVLKSKEVEDSGLLEYVKRAYAGESVDVPIYKFDPTGDTEAKGEGRIRWLSTRIYPIKDVFGKVSNIVIVHQDVSDRKQSEKELKESEEKYRLLLQNSPDAILLTARDGRVLSANAAASKMFQYSEEEICNLGRKGLVDLDDPRLSLLLEQRSSTGKASGEINMLKKDGTKFPVELTSVVFIDRNGEQRTSMVIHDITERKIAEEKMAETQMFLTKAQEIGKIGTWKLNIQDNKLYWTDENYTIFGVETGTPLTFEIFINCVHPDDREFVNREWASKMMTNTYDIEHRLLVDGKVKWVREKAEITFNKKGEPVEAIGFTQDISDRKLSEIVLEMRNEYIESIMENMPIGFAVNTIDDGDVKYMNSHFENVYGWSRDVLTNTSIFFDKVFPDPEYHKKMKAQIIGDMQSGVPERMEWKDLKIVTSSGEVRYVHAFNIPLIDQNMMISTVQDVTTRKLAEDEIEKHRKHLEKLVKERTLELEGKNADLEQMNKLFVGRELRMVELKEKIKELNEKLNH
jgi:PAS domain S-box-containing protein